jgi:hypothetical protein
MRVFALLVLLMPVAAVAAPKKKLDLKPQTTKVEDPGSATHLIYEAPAKNMDKAEESTSVVKPTCTDQMGMIYKKGDKGYSGCLRTMDLAKPADKRHSPSVGFTIGN